LLLTQFERPDILPTLELTPVCQTGKDGNVLNRSRVLVVDEISDTADVLQAVLEPRGMTVNRVSRWCETDGICDDRPAVVVLDAEAFPVAASASRGAWQKIPQVIIGMIRPVASAPGVDQSSDAQRRYLQKPFHFAELVQAIEALIARRA
jgi:DNA-binding response OmpR family regulator